MFGKTTHLELPRRLTSYYFLFGLASVSWLTVGVVLVSQSMVGSHAENNCLAALGTTASDAAKEYRAGGGDRLQGFVDRAHSAAGWVYCALVGPEGRYVAHSLRDRVGQPADRPTGAAMQWGDVERVRFVDSQSRLVREYRTTIRSQGQTLGTLLVAVEEPTVWSALRYMAEYAPATVLGPLFLMCCGAFALRRTVRPLSPIEAQLCQVAAAPADAEFTLSPVASGAAVAEGWNRLAERCNHARQAGRLDSRLAEALEGFRQRKAGQILNSLPDGVALTDDQGRVTFANHALGAILAAPGDHDTLGGRTMEDLLGLDAESDTGKAFFDPDSRARTVVVELARSGEAAAGVLRVARHPLRSATGTAAGGHVWSLRDVTQQKLAEQMRNQFVNSATHELRTPLANIKAYAETLVLSEMLDVERQKEFCNTINAEATRLARFIDDLLSLSSMEVGSLALARQETDLERMFREAIDKVRPQMQQKQITLRCALPEKLPKLKVDKDKIVATLVNLLGNAAKYTPEGGQVQLKVQVKENALQIEVEDSGYGISAEDLPRLFDKFFRSSDPRVQKQSGSGLGLSLVQEVVRLHGGKIGVQSELNKGTRFTLTMPMG